MTSRAKGAAGEREAATILHQAFQDLISKPERNLNQTRDGGHDLNGLPGVALEVKRVERLQVDKWWHQTLDQAHRVNKLPVLMYRQNRGSWCFVLPWGIVAPDMADAPGYFYTDIDGFSAVYRRWLEQHRVED